MITKIVAIGGGEIGAAGFAVETTPIDKEIILLSGKEKPRLLFIPTASSDSEDYAQIVKQHFGKRLSCRVQVLYLLKNPPSQKAIAAKILNSDLIYVGGGNTQKMMSIWRKTGTAEILKKAYQKGIVLSGLSAGAICWFKWGSSDSRKFYQPEADLIKVKGLGLVNAICCPHYNREKDRKTQLKNTMKKTPGIAIALDDCCAIVIDSDQYRIISAKKSAHAYRVYWQDHKFHKEQLVKTRKYQPLSQLLEK